MAKSKYVKFIGKSVYSMLYRPDEYNGDEFWKQGLAVTKEVAEKIKNSGSQAKVKFSENIPNIEDGTRVFTFKRPTCRKDKKTEEIKWNYCPPYILNKKGKKQVWYEVDGKQVQSYEPDADRPDRVGEPFLIGNGSDIEVTLEIYDAKPYGKGTRLASVRVIDLIEYNPSDEEEEDVEVGSEDEEEGAPKEEIPFEEPKSKVNQEENTPSTTKSRSEGSSNRSKVGW